MIETTASMEGRILAPSNAAALSLSARRGAATALLTILLVPMALFGAQPSLVLRSGAIQGARDVAPSPDGKWYATIGNDGAISVWSTADSFQYRTFQILAPHATAGIAGVGLSLSISPDSRTIATADNGVIRLWDVRTATPAGVLDMGDTARILRVVYHPSRKIVASLDNNGTVRIRDTSTGADLFRRNIDGAGVGSSYVQPHLSFSPDGTLLALSTPTAVHLYAWETNRETARFDARAFHADNLGRKLQAVTPASMGMETETFTAEQLHTYEIADIAFDPNAKAKLAIVHRDEVTIVDLSSHKTLETVAIDQPNFTTCLFTPAGELLMGVLGQNSLRYNLATHERSDFPAWSASRFLALPEAGRLLVQFGVGTNIGIGDLNLSGHWYASNASKVEQAWQFQFSPDGKELMNSVNWGSSPMTVWDLTSGEADTARMPMTNLTDFTQSPDGALVAYFGREGYPNCNIHVWNRRTRSEILALPITVVGQTQSLAFSPDGSRLAAVIGEPKAARVWSIPEGKLLGEIPLDEQYAQNRVAWSPDNRTLVISKDTGILIYDAAKGAVPKIRTTIEPPSDVRFFAAGALRFSPKGETLAISGNDGIFLFDTSNWSSRGKVQDAEGRCIAFSADGNRLLYHSQPMNSILNYDNRGLWSWDIAAAKSTVINEDAPVSCLSSQLSGTDLWAAMLNDGIALVAGSDGKLVATLYTFFAEQAADWLVITPDGLFDGTPGAWSQISWRFTNDTFAVLPVESFFQSFYRPGLLAQIASGQMPKAPHDIASIDRRQPRVLLRAAGEQPATVKERTLHLELTVQEAPRRSASGIRLGRARAAALPERHSRANLAWQSAPR